MNNETTTKLEADKAMRKAEIAQANEAANLARFTAEKVFEETLSGLTATQQARVVAIKVLEETLTFKYDIEYGIPCGLVGEAIEIFKKNVLTQEQLDNSFYCDERNDAVKTALKALCESHLPPNLRTVPRFEVLEALNSLDCRSEHDGNIVSYEL